MASPAQIAASIENAAHSTGPVTASGKDAVSRNALTHGLTSNRLLLPGEDPADFEALHLAVVARYNPQNQVESNLTITVAATEWRLARAWRAHDSLLASVVQAEAPARDSAQAVAAIFFTSQHQRSVGLVLRYLRALERANRDAIKALLTTQKQRIASEAEAAQSPQRTQTGKLAPPPMAPVSTAKPAAPPAQLLTRGERRAIERAQRKAAIRAARGTSSGSSALFRTQNAA